MLKPITAIALFATITIPGVSAAQSVYTVTAKGTINQVYASTATPTGAVHVGDPFQAVFKFDTSALTSSVTNNNGDSSGVYGFPLSYMVLAGGFSLSGNTGNPSLVIFDNHVFSPTFTGDSVGFSIFGPYSSDTPFSFSTPGAYSSISLSGYDTDSATLSDVSLSNVTRLNAFANRNAEVAFTNSDFTDSAFFNVTLNSIAVATGAVPEPSTWAMMILGISAVGFAMRRRQKITTRVSYAT